MGILDKIESVITKIMGYLLAILMGIMMVDVFAAVIVRYVIKQSFSFSDEIGRYVFVWIVFIGMAMCVSLDKHVSLDLLPKALKGAPKKYLMLVIYIFQIILFAAILMGSFQLLKIGGNQKSASLRIPMTYIYLCIPICGITSIYFLVLKIIRLFIPGKEVKKL